MLKRILLFTGVCAVTFVLGWIIVPTVFVDTPPQTPVKSFDLSYEHSSYDSYSADDLMQSTETDIEYVSGTTTQTSDDLAWTGRFRSDQFPFKHGESWLGLFREGSKYSIRRTKLSISKVKEPGSTDIDVSTNKPARSLFLVRNMPFLRESDVKTVWDEETTEQPLMPLSAIPRTFELAGKSYTLTVEGMQEGGLIKGSKLVLTSGKDRQILRSLENDCTDCAWTISWAGDLDLDAKLDFFMDLPEKPNTTEKVLFLSSQPIGGKLVKSVASFGFSLTQ